MVGVSQSPRAQLFRAQRSPKVLHQNQNRGTRLVCRVWITDLGALDEERVCGVWWPGFSVVGVLESWAGLVEVDEAGTAPSA